MKERQTVVVYGKPLFMTGVEMELCLRLGITMVRVDASLPESEKHVKMLVPDIIIADLVSLKPYTVLSLIHKYPRLTMVGFDLHGDIVTMLAAKTVSSEAVEELNTVLQSQLVRWRTNTAYQPAPQPMLSVI